MNIIQEIYLITVYKILIINKKINLMIFNFIFIKYLKIYIIKIFIKYKLLNLIENNSNI